MSFSHYASFLSFLLLLTLTHARCRLSFPRTLLLHLSCCQALGQDHPSNACFVMCGSDCQQLQRRLAPTITATIETYTADPQLRFREAQEDEAGNLKAKKKARKTTSRK